MPQATRAPPEPVVPQPPPTMSALPALPSSVHIPVEVLVELLHAARGASGAPHAPLKAPQENPAPRCSEGPVLIQAFAGRRAGTGRASAAHNRSRSRSRGRGRRGPAPGRCYRCQSASHLVRDCLEPDRTAGSDPNRVSLPDGAWVLSRAAPPAAPQAAQSRPMGGCSRSEDRTGLDRKDQPTGRRTDTSGTVEQKSRRTEQWNSRTRYSVRGIKY